MSLCGKDITKAVKDAAKNHLSKTANKIYYNLDEIKEYILDIIHQENIIGKATKNAITEGFDNLHMSITQYTADFTTPAIILGAAVIFCCCSEGIKCFLG